MPYRRSTLTAHAGTHSPGPDAGSRPHAPPIYQTTAFEYDSSCGAEAAAAGTSTPPLGRQYLYARDGSPTEEALAESVAALEGAEATVVFSSGMGAIAAALEAYCGAGGHVVTVDGLYGGSHELISGVLPRFGVTSTFVAAATPAAIEPALKPETRAVYVESISNPLLRVADVDGIAAICRSRGIALLVDATFATPLGQRPVERGATLAIHSATKYLGGHGDAMCGVVSGVRAELAKVRRLRKFHGANCDPFGAWLILRGLRTLALRFERQTATAAKIADGLTALGARVHYPGLASHADHALARRMLDGFGAMVAFDVGELDRARRVYDRLKLIARAASLGDVTSLMTHPARFSHLHVDAETRRRAGITDGLLRLSVGIEDADDLLDDLRQALG
ncbi:MAG TPA: aminotransferase class I/II-fold pyridoxal phosphate-dependent enzyme [Polyangia bacterium]|nr:aminotransferase class I/II-fold pyridoxal phosphate-dependent enzyme [Polyangia bacterium]